MRGGEKKKNDINFFFLQLKAYLGVGYSQSLVEQIMHKTFEICPETAKKIEMGLKEMQHKWSADIHQTLNAFRTRLNEEIDKIDDKRFVEVMEEIRATTGTKNTNRVINYMKEGIYMVLHIY